jgi:hypothetical protein
VLMEIEYPEYDENAPAENWTRKRGFLRLDMAPLDLMPVAVNLFLQQVHHGLWDGCSFIYNPRHILQAGPHAHDVDERLPRTDALLHRFVDARLDTMPYQEYHEEYPHEAYTIGFAGRPGGTDIYINKVNNTINHGPGGQGQHSLHEEADPCFARVATSGEYDGRLLLDNLYRVPTSQNGNRNFLSHPVVIVTAKITSSRGGGG